MPGQLRRMAGQGSALFSQLQKLLKGTDPKEIEAIVNAVVEITAWAEEAAEILREEKAVVKAMVVLNAGVKIVELITLLASPNEGDNDPSDAPSWFTVLVLLAEKIRASMSGDKND